MFEDVVYLCLILAFFRDKGGSANIPEKSTIYVQSTCFQVVLHFTVNGHFYLTVRKWVAFEMKSFLRESKQFQPLSFFQKAQLTSNKMIHFSMRFSTVNQKLLCEGFLKLTIAMLRSTPCERAFLNTNSQNDLIFMCTILLEVILTS